jgi:hypothetical protein
MTYSLRAVDNPEIYWRIDKVDEFATIIRYLQKHRGRSLSEARRRLALTGVEAWQVDYCLEWLQTVAGCRDPEELRSRIANFESQGSWSPYDPGFNLTQEAYATLVGLRGLGVFSDDDLRNVLERVFNLPDTVDSEELQEILLHDAYGRMPFAGEGMLIEEGEQWGNKN